MNRVRFEFSVPGASDPAWQLGGVPHSLALQTAVADGL